MQWQSGCLVIHLRMNKLSIRSRAFVAASVFSLILLLDQFIKYKVKTGLLLHEKVEVTSWFQICFTENRGMAFGMDFIGTSLLTLFRLVVIGAFVYVLIRCLKNKRYPLGFIVCISCIIAGAAGNIVDNTFYGLIFSESPEYSPFLLHQSPAHLVPWGEGYGDVFAGWVVDMFYFPLFIWPDWVPFLKGEYFFNAIFNFADAAISCGAVALFLFYRRYINGLLQTETDENQVL